MKCSWCNKSGGDVVVFYEVWHGKNGEPQHVHRSHLIPGTDPCPVKVYKIEEIGKMVVRRIWDNDDEWPNKVASRMKWFKEHPDIFYKELPTVAR